MAVMASSINFNTVWTSIFEPLPTFMFLERYGKESTWAQAPRPAVSGRRLATRRASCCAWAPRCATGSRATRSPSTATTVDDQDPSAHDDSMLATNQRIWGFETNFGGLADVALVKANQLMPKPAHLTWEESAVNALCNSTVVPHARRCARRADEAGRRRARLGRDRRHRRLRGAVRAERRRHPGRRRGSPDKADILRDMGCEAVIDRAAGGYRFWKDDDARKTSPSGGGSARTSAQLVRRRPRHRVRAPRPADDGCVDVRREARRHRRHVRGDVAATWSSSTTATSG